MATQFVELLHRQLHKLPGMPPHSEAARRKRNMHALRLPAQHNQSRTLALAHHFQALKSPNMHHARVPRVLVAWQEWIGGLFAGRRGQA